MFDTVIRSGTIVDGRDVIERSDVSVGDLTFQARRAGPADGRPVILLHGVPQTSACWFAQLEALGAAGRRAIAFTQRGYSPGARIDDVAAFTMDKLTGDVLGVADELGFERFDVVGHEGMRGCLDWYRAGALQREPGADFPDIEIPTLYVWSTDYPALGPEGAYATEAHVSGSYRFIVLEGIGHWIPELAAEQFNEALLAHLAAHPAG